MWDWLATWSAEPPKPVGTCLPPSGLCRLERWVKHRLFSTVWPPLDAHCAQNRRAGPEELGYGLEKSLGLWSSFAPLGGAGSLCLSFAPLGSSCSCDLQMNLGHVSLMRGNTVSTWISSLGRGQASDNQVLSSTAEVPFSSWG